MTLLLKIFLRLFPEYHGMAERHSREKALLFKQITTLKYALDEALDDANWERCEPRSRTRITKFAMDCHDQLAELQLEHRGCTQRISDLSAKLREATALIRGKDQWWKAREKALLKQFRRKRIGIDHERWGMDRTINSW